MDVYFTTGEKVSSKSTLAVCVNPLATKRALCLSIVPSALVLTLKTHFESMIFLPSGAFTWSYVLCSISEEYSLSSALFHSDFAEEFSASSIVVGSSIILSAQL